MKRSRLAVVFGTVLLASLPGCEGACLAPKLRTGTADRSPLKGRSQETDIAEMQAAFRDVHDLYEKRVVLISTERVTRVPPGWEFFHPFGARRGKEPGLGSGFFLTADGYICTNHHVVADVDQIKVRVGVTEYSAKVVGSDEMSDLALLKIEGRGFEPAFLGDSDRVHVGDWAIAIGNPFGLERSFTVGVVSAAVRTGMDAVGNNHIQTDASINPGNSGGPLINIDGEVIGINRMIYSKSGGSLGIGFAIPINEAKRILNQLRRTGKVARGYIGAQIADLNEQLAQRLGLREVRGVYIAGVVPGGPAEKGGLREGDVILTVNGRTTRRSGDLLGEVSRTPVGSAIRLSLWRSGRAGTATIRTALRP